MVTAPAAGWLVFNDAYAAVWRAEVNGSRAEIFRANLLVRAVLVPAGESRVVFTFWPTRQGTGLILSAVPVLLLGLSFSLQLRGKPGYERTEK
jgi:uncharacterized membrane protein YfhO